MGIIRRRFKARFGAASRCQRCEPGEDFETLSLDGACHGGDRVLNGPDTGSLFLTTFLKLKSQLDSQESRHWPFQFPIFGIFQSTEGDAPSLWMSSPAYRVSIQTLHQPTNQPADQQTDKQTNKQTNKPITNQPNTQPTNQPTNRTTDQTTNQATKQTIGWFHGMFIYQSGLRRRAPRYVCTKNQVDMFHDMFVH